jgi:hypothetical protein
MLPQDCKDEYPTGVLSLASIRRQMTASLQQVARVERGLTYVCSNRDRELVEYEDDVWNFFQNAWHLKDWVKNDLEVSSQHLGAINVRRISSS